MAHDPTAPPEGGITITKSLAWVIVSGLVGAAIFFGIELGNVRTEISNIRSDLQQAESARLVLAERVRELERQEAEDRANVAAMLRLLERIEGRVTVMDNRLRAEERRGDRFEDRSE